MSLQARRDVLMTQLRQDLEGDMHPQERAWVELGSVSRFVMWLLLPRKLYRQIEWVDQGEDGVSAVFLARK